MPELIIEQTLGTKQRVTKLRQFSDRGLLHQDDLTGGITTLAELALTIIKAATPGSGKVRDLWMLSQDERAKVVTWVIRNSGTYQKDTKGRTLLDYLEFGTKPHIITPLNAQALRFVIENKVIFTKIVRHPGTAPYSMIAKGEKAVLDGLDKLIRNIERRISREAEGLS